VKAVIFDGHHLFLLHHLFCGMHGKTSISYTVLDPVDNFQKCRLKTGEGGVQRDEMTIPPSPAFSPFFRRRVKTSD
jgi:hypothetical protein